MRATDIYMDNLITRYPVLTGIRKNIEESFHILLSVYKQSGKVLVAGNGGSAADAEHMTGELMKGFLLRRPIDNDLRDSLLNVDEIVGRRLSEVLQRPLTVIPLGGCGALATAYINDVESDSLYAQQLLGLGKKGDVFIGISTSGNSRNILDAAVLARAIGMTVIGLTGKDGGKLKNYTDVIVPVPERETYIVQEYYLPIYHCWCMMLEEYFFGGGDREI